ncbi:MAG: hypothetical protein ACE5ID_11475 [Acidobacteriota bacterium]
MYAAHGDVRPAGEVAYILKRYPRLSETFIVNEILALERRGVCLRILAAARPQEGLHHEMVEQVQAPVVYTRKKARRIWRSSPHRMWRQAGVSRKLGARLLEEAACCSDSSEAMEELAQALLVAAHVNGGRIVHLHAHFATSAARIACLASRLTGVPFSFTAHAKDIFMNSVDEKTLAGLLARASFVVAISSYHARFL